MCLIFYDCWGWCTMYHVPAAPSRTHTLSDGALRKLVSFNYFAISYSWRTTWVSMPSRTPRPPSSSWPTSALVSVVAAACACALYILLLSISMINKCRPQHYWHLNHNNNSASFGQNMLRLYKLHSPSSPAHTLEDYTHTHTTQVHFAWYKRTQLFCHKQVTTSTRRHNVQ